MKRVLSSLAAVLLAICLAMPVYGESIDFTGYSDEDLLDLLKQTQNELRRRFDERLASPVTDFLYTSDGREVRINAYTGSGQRVVIPSEIDGAPVTRIYDAAFQGASLLSVEMPDTITDIGRNAFSHNWEIGAGAVLALPSGLRRVGVQAFAWSCYEGIIIGSDALIESDAFQDMSKAKFLYIRDGAAPMFDRWSVRGCADLEIAIIPPAVTYIDDAAFEGSKKLKIITTPGSAAAAWATRNFFPVDTENYEAYVAEFETLYPRQ